MNNLAPRLGVTWDPANNGRTVVRAGYGIYYDQINTTTMRGVVAGYPGFITTQIANDARSGSEIPNDFFPNLPTRTFPESAGTAFNVASDSAESPYTHQMTAGATRQLRHQFRRVVRLRLHARRQLPGDPQCQRPAGQQSLPAHHSAARDCCSTPMRRRCASTRRSSGCRSASPAGSASCWATRSAAPRRWPTAGTPSNHYDLQADWGPTSNDVRHRFVFEHHLRAAVAVPGRPDRDRQLGAALQHHARHGRQSRR